MVAAVVLLHLVACTAEAPASRAGQDGTAAVPATAAVDAAYRASIERWREQREADLRDPDGWLSFAGSGTLRAGTHRVGSDPGSDIVVPGGPARWGVLHVDADDVLRFDAAPGAGVTVDGKAFERTPLLTQLDAGGPTAIHAGAQRFYVVKTGDLYGWRFRDPASPALRAFEGVPHFPVDPSWRIDARWEPFPEPRELQLATSNGTLKAMRVPGRAIFERGGERHALLAVREAGEDQLFFIFSDRSSGRDSYGGGRFLYTALPSNGRVALDFNKAENPPCALNGHVVCPLAPPGNRLALRIAAGEKTYPRTAGK